MRALTLAICTILTGTLAHGDPGFLHLPFPEITQEAREAAASVFEIHQFDLNSRMTINLESFGATYAAKIKADHLQPRVEKIVLLQLQQCRERKLMKACDIFTNTLHASGFLVEDEFTLLTTLPIQNRSTPFAIFNLNNELIYWGEAKMEKAPVDSNMVSQPITRIRLNTALGRPLSPAKQLSPALVRSRVFAIGYPAGTGRYLHKTKFPDYGLESRNPLPDSKGDGIFYSIGQVLSVDPNGWIVTDADAVTGSEGGPILNDAGEVVGIVLGSHFSHNAEGALRIRQNGLSLKVLSGEIRD